MNNIINNYNVNSVNELFIDIHEFGGFYINDKGLPGMTDKEILQINPNIIIPSDVDITDGWWKSENKETEINFKERVKRVITKLKDIAKNNEEDYTICLISHNLFINMLFTLLLCADPLVESI